MTTQELLDYRRALEWDADMALVYLRACAMRARSLGDERLQQLFSSSLSDVEMAQKIMKGGEKTCLQD